MLILEVSMDLRKVKAAALIDEVNEKSTGTPKIFSDENNFDRAQKSNNQNERWILKTSKRSQS